MNPAEYLRAAREARCWTQEELARQTGWVRGARVGVACSSVASIELGHHSPSRQKAILIADAFGWGPRRRAEWLRVCGHDPRQEPTPRDEIEQKLDELTGAVDELRAVVEAHIQGHDLRVRGRRLIAR